MGERQGTCLQKYLKRAFELQLKSQHQCCGRCLNPALLPLGLKATCKPDLHWTSAHVANMLLAPYV